jgi:hypothetical protein
MGPVRKKPRRWEDPWRGVNPLDIRSRRALLVVIPAQGDYPILSFALHGGGSAISNVSGLVFDW